MKIKFNITALILCAAAFASCKHADSFILSGEVANSKNIQKVYLLQKDTTTVTMVDSAALSDQHKFSFKHDAPSANLYILKVGGTMFDLIAKNGDDISFKTDAADTTNAYQISGSMDSEKIKEFNKMGNRYQKMTDQILTVYNYKTKVLNQPGPPLFAIALQQFKQNQKDYSKEILKFMHDNQASLAAYYASTSLDPVLYESQLIDFAEDIKGKFPDNNIVQNFAKKMAYAKPVSVGHAAPDFMVMDEAYKPVKISDYKGKYLMIDFWASWCAPCRQENPNVVKMYAAYKNKGLNILGFSLDNNRIDWETAIRADNLTWRHASQFKGFDSPVVREFHIESIPSNFIIGPDGNIVAKNLQGADLEDFLNKTFNKSNL